MAGGRNRITLRGVAVHVAILKRDYLDRVLSGKKTVESRMTKTAMPPFGCIEPGETIFLKESGGRFRAEARAGRVWSFEDLTAAKVEQLRRRFQKRVGGDAAYWQSKQDARYATFVELTEVVPAAEGPDYAKSPYRAWFVLRKPAKRSRKSDKVPAQAPPGATTLTVELTQGGLRNGYVGVAGRRDFFPAGEFSLSLPDGTLQTTMLYRGVRIRWRGWGPYFDEHRLRPGDAIRFTPQGSRGYRVSFHRRTQ